MFTLHFYNEQERIFHAEAQSSRRTLPKLSNPLRSLRLARETFVFGSVGLGFWRMSYEKI